MINAVERATAGMVGSGERYIILVRLYGWWVAESHNVVQVKNILVLSICSLLNVLDLSDPPVGQVVGDVGVLGVVLALVSLGIYSRVLLVWCIVGEGIQRARERQRERWREMRERREKDRDRYRGRCR